MRGVFGRWCGAAWLVAGALLVSLAGCDNSPWESGAAEPEHVVQRDAGGLAAPHGSDGVLLVQRHHLHLPDLRAALRLPLPEAAYTLIGKSAQDVAKPRYLRQGRQAAARRRAGRPGRRERLRRPDQARHPVPAAPGVRQGRQRQLLYHPMKPGELGARSSPMQFEHQGTRELVADDFVYALKRHATPRITTPIYGIFSEYVIGLKDYGDARSRAEDAQAARRARSGQPRPPVPRLPQVPAGRRHRARQVHVPRAHQGPLSAVELLDGDDLHGAGAVGGRRVLRAARHGRGQPDARHLARGHRPVHADRVLQGSPPGDDAQPELPRRAVSLRGHARRQGERPARRLRQEDAVRRQDRRHRRAREGAAEGQVPAGLLRPRGVRAHRPRHGIHRRQAGLRGRPQGVRRQGLPPRPLRRRLEVQHRLQHARSGDRQGRHARAAGEEPQAAPGDDHRDRLGGVTRRSSRTAPAPRRRARCPTASSARASPRPRASTRSRTGWSTACPCGARSRTRSS